jgi:hypothetical protein
MAPIARPVELPVEFALDDELGRAELEMKGASALDEPLIAVAIGAFALLDPIHETPQP